MGHILIFGATREQIQATADAFNDLFPGSARAPRPDNTGAFDTAFKAWWADEFKILVLGYNQCHGFRAPDDTKVILLDGCPSEGHRQQALMRVRHLDSPRAAM